MLKINKVQKNFGGLTAVNNVSMRVEKGSITGLMPVVGIPLPLLSYGGTAMLSIMISFGLLLNVALHYNYEKMNQ